MKLAIVLLIATCIYSITSLPIREIKSETEFENLLRSSSDMNIILIFVDDERGSKDILSFWEEQQDMLDEQFKPTPEETTFTRTAIYFVNVNKVISLQRKYKIDKKGDTIFFNRGVESVRASWTVPHRMKKWITILLEPESLDISVSFSEFQEKSKNISALVTFSDEIVVKQAALLNERQTIGVFQINKEDRDEFFKAFPTPSEVSRNSKNLFFYKRDTSDKYFYEEFEGFENSLLDSTIALSEWISINQIKGIKSILESSPENFRKHAEIYRYVVVVPYPAEKKEEYINIIYQVEENEENAEFGFLYLESSQSMMPYPISFEIDHSPNPKKELRTMWDPNNEFTLENFNTWITKIRTNTHEPFTTMSMPEPPAHAKLFDIKSPITSINFQELHDLHKKSKEFSLIFCYTYDKTSAKAYYFLEELVHKLHLDIYAYNVLTNTYTGPPAPVLLIVKGDLESYIPLRKMKDSEGLHKSILSELSKLDHRADL